MKTSILFPVAAVAAIALSLASCKTNEQNYRNAYEVAKQAQYTGVDSTIYAKIRQEAVPTAVMADGDSIRMKTEFVTATKGAADKATATVKRYGVVVGQFKQVFNARAMLSRISANGYPGAYIVETREPLYYVVAYGTDNLDEAAATMKRVAKDSSMRLREPLPWIIQSATHNR